jgi:hypothetical protein
MTAPPRPSSPAHRAMAPAYFRGYPASFWQRVMGPRPSRRPR